MSDNNIKTSLLVSSQLPEYIRDDPAYDNFKLFLQAYYEWLELSGNPLDRTKNILNYKDIDRTTDEFLNYFTNDFLQYFPEDILIDKRKAVKLARELYQTKGTLSSYKLLFRILYNSDFDLYNTGDSILRCSDGDWYITRSLKISSEDVRFLETKNYQVLGETSKSIATIENVIISGSKVEIFISNMQRSFISGEYVRILDNEFNDIIINGSNLRAKITGQVTQVNIDQQNKGLNYQIGDPVVFYGGLSFKGGKGASAIVSDITKGSIKNVTLVDGGYGYRSNSNTIINITNGFGATAQVSSINANTLVTSFVNLFPTDTILLKKNVPIGNAKYHFASFDSANANTKLINALSFINFNAYPIKSVVLTNEGLHINATPTITADSIALTDYSNTISTSNTEYANSYAYIKNLGILAPLQILNGGSGYTSNDTITITGGSGYGAYANISVSNGSIVSVSFVNGSSNNYVLGGMGYRPDALPSITINSGTGSNASIIVPGILGYGAQFSSYVDKVGSILSVKMTDNGEDYESVPSISFKVQDIIVNNINPLITQLPEVGDIVYQGADIGSSVYYAYVDSIIRTTNSDVPENTQYRLRVYDFSNDPITSLPLKIPTKNFSMNILGFNDYGDGNAKGTAEFINGLVISEGQYISSKGHLSSYSILQDENHNSFTYMITVEKEIAKYRDILQNLLHPSGMKIIGRYSPLMESDFNTYEMSYDGFGVPLRVLANTNNSYVTMSSDFTNRSNNIITFKNLNNTIANVITINDIIEINPSHGPNIKSEIVSINYTSNTITLKDNVWLTYANVANVTGNVGTNIINIKSLTGYFDIINNGHYNDANYPLKDIVFVGDTIEVGGVTKTVTGVDYANGIITLSTNLVTDVTSYMSVKRNFTANSSPTLDQVIIWQSTQTTTSLSLTTESNLILITENGSVILQG